MKTVFRVEQTPLSIIIQPPYPWKPRSSISFLIPTPNNHPSYTAKNQWKIDAKGKRFNGRNLEKQKLLVQEEEREKKVEADDKIPDVVMNRIIARILFNVGVPIATGLALLQMFSILKDRNIWDVPLWLPFLTTLITFGASTVGIAFGALSTSWDAEEKGSVLGFQEAQKNWVEIWREEDDA